MSNSFLYLEKFNLDENEEINIRNSYLSLRVKLSDVLSALSEIKRQTKAKTLNTAIEMMYFCSPSKEKLSSLGLIITIQRCSRDGNVIPMVSLAELYQAIESDHQKGY